MKINVNSLESYIFCPMSYLLRYRYRVHQPIVTSKSLYDWLLARYSRSIVAYIMEGKSRHFVKKGWSKRNSQIPDGFRNHEYFVTGGLFVSLLYDTQEQWEYFASGHPYEYKVGKYVLEGTVDALRLNKEGKVQIVSVGRRPIPNAAANANDIVGVLNRGVFARTLEEELKAIGPVQSVLVSIPDAVTFVVKDSKRVRDRTESYIQAILRGIENKVFYPRYQSCRLCGYAPICDPQWCTVRAQAVPRKTAKAIHKLLEGLSDEKSTGRESFTKAT